MHALIQSEGYAQAFTITKIPLSATLKPIIASDFDHIIINQRLHREGYFPETGFMANMKDQYKSWVNSKVAVLSPEQRAVFGVIYIHELIKHVIYIESPTAEKELLDTYPMYQAHWLKVKSAIRAFQQNPTPHQEWKFLGVYVREMDSIFSEAGMNVLFSDLVGFFPLLVTDGDLHKPASSFLTFSVDRASGIMRLKAKANGIMVGAISGGDPALDLSQPLERVASDYHVDLFHRKPRSH
jgi:hypothetical protein